MKADQIVRAATAELGSAGVESPLANARTLLAHAWGIPVSEVGRHILRGTPVSAEVVATFRNYVTRRMSREPLQHITGVAAFRYLELEVGPGVFIPRPETELVTQYTIDHIRESGACHVVDLCTGTGAIALAIATECAGVHVDAVELSPAAASYATHNIAAHAHQLAARVSEVTLHVGDATAWGETTSAQVVVCNPPYVAQHVAHPAEVAHDPMLALDGGGDNGTELPTRIIAAAAGILRPGGLLVLEHAEYHVGSIRQAFDAAGFAHVATHADYTGRDRFTTGLTRKDSRGSHL